MGDGHVLAGTRRSLLKRGLRKTLPGLIYWRRCALLLFLVFAIVAVAFEGPQLLGPGMPEPETNADGSECLTGTYADLFKGMPQKCGAKLCCTYLSYLIWALWGWDLVFFIFNVLSIVLGFLAFIFYARAYRMSRALVLTSWGVVVLPAFFIMLLLPVRLFVPWAIIQEEICKETLKETLINGDHGVELSRCLETRTLLPPDDPLYLNEPLYDGLSENTWPQIKAYCAKHGQAWAQLAFEDISSTLELMGDCLRQGKPSDCFADDVASEMNDDHWSCTDQDLTEGDAAFLGTAWGVSDCLDAFALAEVEFGSGNGGSVFCHDAERYCCETCEDVTIAEGTDLMTACQGDDSELCQRLNLLDDISNANAELLRFQFEHSKVAAQHAINVLNQADTILGLAMGAYTMKALLPKSVSVIAALPLGLQNVKSMLFESSLPGYLLVLVTACVLPIYAGYLATVQQVLGDYYLIPGLLFLLLYFMMGIWWGHKLAQVDEVVMMMRQFLCQTVIGTLLLTISGVFLVLWVFTSKLSDYVNLPSLASAPSIIGLAFGFLARKLLTQVAFTDCMMMLFAAIPQIAGDSQQSAQVLQEYRGITNLEPPKESE